MKNKEVVLVLGATGMLGHTLFKTLRKDNKLRVFGTSRQKNVAGLFSPSESKAIITNIDAQNPKALDKIFSITQPTIVINCIGIIKQLEAAEDVLQTIPINTLLPHHLAKVSAQYASRLILISTDCVFSGNQGNYKETDISDCQDLYGKSKYLGEIHNLSHVLTVRTSIIGHELRGGHSLVNWFLSQKDKIKGFSNAIYSGLPTIELANIIHKLIIPNHNLHGLYHIASKPISKYELLTLIAKIYQKKISISKSLIPKINRSLNSKKFERATGYKAKTWDLLIKSMHSHFIEDENGL